MRIIFTLITALLSLPFAGCAAAEEPAGVPAAVVQVRDGDTVVVELEGLREDVRLLGVDTPEMNYRTGEPEPMALEATLFTREQAGGGAVGLAPDPLSQDRDRYDRLLRYVHLPDGRLLNLELVRDGYAFAFLEFPVSRREALIDAQVEAITARRGLWSDERLTSTGYDSAGRYEGQAVAVRGSIVRSRTVNTRSGKRICFLNFHEDYRRYVSVVILESEFHRFGGDPESLYDGRTVTVSGRVMDRRGRLQIAVYDPAQIVLSD